MSPEKLEHVKRMIARAVARMVHAGWKITGCTYYDLPEKCVCPMGALQGPDPHPYVPPIDFASTALGVPSRWVLAFAVGFDGIVTSSYDDADEVEAYALGRAWHARMPG